MGRRLRKRNRKTSEKGPEDVQPLQLCSENEEETAQRASTCKKRKTTSDSSDSGMSGLGLDSGLDGMEDSSQESPHGPPDSGQDIPNLSGLDRFSEPNFLKSKTDLESCHMEGETIGIKSEIFDPSYDFHQNFIEDNGLDFRNSLDKDPDIHEPMKGEEVGDLTFSREEESSLAAVSVSKEDHSSTSKQEISLGCLTSSQGAMVSAPSLVVGSGTSPVTAAAIGQPATAMAHIVRVEPGVDGKGYMLHLSIPSLGIGNLILYTSGLPNLQLQQQLQQQSIAAAASLPSPVILSSSGVDSQKSSYAEHNFLGPLGSMSPQEGAIAECSNSVVTMQEATNTSYIKIEPDSLIEADSLHTPDPVLTVKADDLSNESLESLEPDPATLNSNGRDLQMLLTEKNSLTNPSGTDKYGATLDPEQGGDVISVAQFVICSDGPMKCELCTFQTDSYSSFKSHIICSHPCWRITKKLSKNRLLVEQSVRASHLPTTVSMRQNSKKGNLSAKNEETPETRMALKMFSSAFSSAAPKMQQIMARNKRIFQCGLCQRPFVFEGSAVNHIIDTHCHSDPYEFMQVSNDHGQTFTKCIRPDCMVMEDLSGRQNGKVMAISRCQICGYTANSSEQLNEHAKRIHSKQVLMYGISDCID